jgi:microsomal dipeptidase-like Zn-dependent dipeptidase
MFSHSSVYGICKHSRNVPDDVIRLTHEKNGVIMVTAYTNFVHEYERLLYEGIFKLLYFNIKIIKNYTMKH